MDIFLFYRIWSLIKRVGHKSDKKMTSSLPYTQFEDENYSDDQLDLPLTPVRLNTIQIFNSTTNFSDSYYS